MFARHWPAVLILWSGLAAQSNKAELFGVLLDPAGESVASATVRLTATGTGSSRETMTATDGSYYFPAMEPGEYALTALSPGWPELRRPGIVLRVGDRQRLDLTWNLDALVQVLEVDATAPILHGGRGSVASVVEQRKIVNLPLDGRNFVPLIALAPGVSLAPGSVLPRINGSRPRVSEYIYDGISVLQPEPGQVAFYPVIDAIEEFRVEVNSYSAEYGRSNGGVILVHQKSGTNQWRGTLFEFFRNEKLNARNLFATSGPKPVFRRNQYGGVVGGPLRRDRTFVFGDWQGTRWDTGVVRVSSVPLTNEREGRYATPVYDPATTRQTGQGYVRDAFPDNRIPAARWDPAAQALLQRYPRPEAGVSGSESRANNFRRTGVESTSQDQFDGRLDHLATDTHRAMARFTLLRDESRPVAPLPDGSGRIASGILAATSTRAWNISGEHTWTISPRTVLQSRAGHTARGFNRSALPLALYEPVGLQHLGPPPNSSGEFRTSVTQWVNTLSAIRGRHSLKAGLDLRRQRLNVFQPANPLGAYQFTAIATSGITPSGASIAGTGNVIASMLLGQVQRYTRDVQEETIRPRASIFECFVQDDWQAHPRLSVNFGVRYTLNFPSTVEEDMGAVFDLARQRLRLLGRDGNPRTARRLEPLNLGPRVGLAVRLSDKAVVRAGYGMTWIEQAGITTPFTTPLFPFVQTLSQESLDNLAPAFELSRGPSVQAAPPGPDAGLGQGVFGAQRENGSGYAQQWNLTFQRSFGKNWSLQAGYLGSKLTRLGVPDVNLNQLHPRYLSLGSALTQPVTNPFQAAMPPGSPLARPLIARNQLLRPFPRFTAVTLYRNNTGHSTYHAVQAHLEKRFGAGLTLTAAYTFSRLIDDAGAVFDSALLSGPVTNYQAADSYNKRLEKDVSSGNVPHILSSGFVYELPVRGRWTGGWQVAGIVRWQSGSPVAVTQATNLNAFAGFGIQRPNRLKEPALPSAERTTARWFDTAAFAPAPQFTLGDSSRNPVSGPGFRTLDLMAGKTWRLTERWRLETRLEAFNALNTPPLGNPNGAFGAPAFGSITTALDPRVFECVMKLSF